MKNQYKLILNKQAEMDKEAVIMLFPALMAALSGLSIYDASKSIPQLYKHWKQGKPLTTGALKVGMDVAGALPLIGGAVKGVKVAGGIGKGFNLWRGGKHSLKATSLLAKADKFKKAGNLVKHNQLLKRIAYHNKYANKFSLGSGYGADGLSNLMRTGTYGKLSPYLHKADTLSGYGGMAAMGGSFLGNKFSKDLLNYGYDSGSSLTKVDLNKAKGLASSYS